MPDVFTTRHNVMVNEKTHGGRAMVVFRDSMDVDDNPDNTSKKQNSNDPRRNSQIIDQQPAINRFMDPREIEWQAQKSREDAPKKPNKSEEKKPDGKDPKKEEEDESKYFCCS